MEMTTDTFNMIFHKEASYLFYSIDKKVKLFTHNTHLTLLRSSVSLPPEGLSKINLENIHQKIKVVTDYLIENDFIWYVTPLPAGVIKTYDSKTDSFDQRAYVVKTQLVRDLTKESLDEMFIGEDGKKFTIILYYIDVAKDIPGTTFNAADAGFLRYARLGYDGSLQTLDVSKIFNIEIIDKEVQDESK